MEHIRHEEFMKRMAGVPQEDTFQAADMVNSPPHYNQGSIECIDAIEAALGPDGFIAYCRGNAIKYLWRSDHKGGAEDIKKANWYLARMVAD